MPTPKSLMRTNSVMTPSIEYKKQLSRMESNKNPNTIEYKRQLSRLESNKSKYYVNMYCKRTAILED